MGKNNPAIPPLHQNSLRCKHLQAGPGLGAHACCQALRAGCWGHELLVCSSRTAPVFSFGLFLSKQYTVFISDVKHNALSSHTLIFLKEELQNVVFIIK